MTVLPVTREIVPIETDPVDADQRFIVHGIPWKDYVLLRDTLEIPWLRMSYCEGTLELMSPSTKHENSKKIVARLVELFSLVRDVPLYGYGNATFRKKAQARGLEPDECWCVGHAIDEVPDIALEIVFSPGGIDKLRIYAGLGVPEVWFWTKGRFRNFWLEGKEYREAEGSRFIPDLDFEILATFARREDQPEVVKDYRDFLQR